MKTEDSINPSSRTVPAPRYISLPEPVESTRGISSNRLVEALMNIGPILFASPALKPVGLFRKAKVQTK